MEGGRNMAPSLSLPEACALEPPRSLGQRRVKPHLASQSVVPTSLRP